MGVIKNAKEMIKKLRQMLCSHYPSDFDFVRKIHGDEINAAGGKRYEYKCNRCGALILRDTPMNCGGCKHIYCGKFGTYECDRDSRIEKACLNSKSFIF